MPSFGKRTPFSASHLEPFEACYAETPRVDQGEEGRWRSFSREYIRDTKGDSLDISWLKDENSVDAANLPEPDVLAAEAMSELTEALRELDGLLTALGKGDEAKVQKDLLAEVLGLEVKA
jgi:type I restriction enzyme M protein